MRPRLTVRVTTVSFKYLISILIDATLVQGEFSVFIQRENFRACIILSVRETTINGRANSGDK